jgi:Txe/YoeB family toxin of toxin-antitoxin system
VNKDERSTFPVKKYDFFHESTTPGLKDKAEKLLTVLAENPSQSPLSFEKLKGTSLPVYSRRINIHHRLVY